MTQHNTGLSRTTMAGEVLPPERRGSAVSSDFAWVDTSWGAARKATKVAATVTVLTQGLEKCREYNEAALRYELSAQQLAAVRAQGRSQAELLPFRAERQMAVVYKEIVEAQTDVDRAIHARQISQLRHEEQTLEVRLRIRRLEAELGNLSRPAPATPPPDATPQAFTRAWATEKAVRENRAPANSRITEIYARCASERRVPTADELEEIDALNSAAEGAESEVRRGAASGLR